MTDGGRRDAPSTKEKNFPTTVKVEGSAGSNSDGK